jgi:hypothetical protein
MVSLTDILPVEPFSFLSRAKSVRVIYVVSTRVRERQVLSLRGFRLIVRGVDRVRNRGGVVCRIGTSC